MTLLLFNPVISILESLPGADCFPVQNAQTYIESRTLGQANSSGTVCSTHSGHSGLSPEPQWDQAWSGTLALFTELET